VVYIPEAEKVLDLLVVSRQSDVLDVNGGHSARGGWCLGEIWRGLVTKIWWYC